MAVKLEQNWLTDGWIDFEYKKYLLLAYLQYVRKYFQRNELYPPLAELLGHYRDLQQYRKNENELKENMLKELDKIDAKKFRLVYKDVLSDGDILKVIREIIDFSIPLFREAIDEGKDIYEIIEKQLTFEPIGIMPIYQDEGLLMVHSDSLDVQVYRYQLSKIILGANCYRSLKTELIEIEKKGIGVSMEQIKSKIIRKIKDLPAPATYSIFSQLRLPVKETLMPIAKRILIQELSRNAA